MWDGLMMLLFLSLLMATASFLAGYAPLSLSLSSKQLRLITALGTGVLVGTSLIVIIPEGVETLYSANGSVGRSHHERGVSRITREATIPDVGYDHLRNDIGRRDGTTKMLRADMNMPAESNTKATDILNRQTFSNPIRSRSISVSRFEDAVSETVPGFVPPGMDTDGDFGNQLTDDQFDEHAASSPDSGSELSSSTSEISDAEQVSNRDPHVWVGISLILGFALMYLIDIVPQHANVSSKPERFHISLGQFSFTRPRSVSTDTDGIRNPGSSSADTSSSRPSSTTVGLVIHAAADGIALGASSTNPTGNLSFIIFIAIMIHKAPAAFGLTTVLLKQGLTRRQARAHLIIFALAAPAGALLTWATIHLLGFSGDSVDGSSSNTFATGVLLLFSAGTFLYVAVHTMQESSSSGHEHSTNGYNGVPMTDMYSSGSSSVQPKPHEPTLLDTVITVVGMFLPLLAQWADMH